MVRSMCMSGKSPAVSDLIAREIDASGPISFARFMELALYDPGDSYYASGKVRIGKQGDFFTNVSVGAFFGRLLAGQFVEVWDRLGKPDDFTVVEQGAHDGTLAADVRPLVRLNVSIVNGTLTTVRSPRATCVGSPWDW